MNHRIWILALKIGVTATLLSRGWLTFRWDSPIRNLLWHEDWLAAPLETLTGITWEDYALQSGPYLETTFQIIGVSLLVMSVLPWICIGRKSAGWLWLPVIFLVLDSIGRWIGTGYDFGMAIEHSLQMGTPIALWLALRHPERNGIWLKFVLTAAALTFVGHGFYAAGVHPVPLSYQTMTMDLLRIDQGSALLFLEIVGWLDFVSAFALFVPILREPALIYMVAWGGMTAAARIVSHFGFDQPLFGLDPWLAETLVRTPHWLLPLLAYFCLGKVPPAKKNDSGSNPSPSST